MRFITPIIIFTTTIAALPITSDISAPANPSANALENAAVMANIAAVADVNNDQHDPPAGARGPPSAGAVTSSVGYGLGEIVGTPLHLLGDLGAGAASGLVGGLKGGPH